MIIDGHVKIGPSFDRKGKEIDEYLLEMKKNGIARAVLCPNKPISYDVLEGNEYTAAAVKKYPDLFYGAFRVDPWRWEELKPEAERLLKEKVCRFLYLHPWEDSFRINDPMMYSVLEYAAEAKVPVIVETGMPFVSHISQLGEIAERYPALRIITTNAAQVDLSGFSLADVGYMLHLHQNLYLGTAAAVGAEWLVNQIENNAAGRVIFQTQYPYCDPYMEKFRIDHAYTDEVHKEQVFSGNLLALLG